MKPIADALKEYLNARGAKNQFQLARLWENWEMVMGPDLAALAFPLGQRKGILLVGAEDNMAAQDLSYMSPEILERVNAFMDGPFFNRVEVHLLFGRTPLDTTRVVVPPSSRVPLPPGPRGLAVSCSRSTPKVPSGAAISSTCACSTKWRVHANDTRTRKNFKKWLTNEAILLHKRLPDTVGSSVPIV